MMDTDQKDKLIRALEAVRQNTGSAHGLPNEAYTESSMFQFERDSVLGKSWSGLCFTSELPAPGFAKPIDFMGLPLVVIRDRDDRIKVFHNVCLHRGMILVREATPIKQVFQCPYHSWAYNQKGELVGTPHIGGTDKHSCEGFSKSGRQLSEVSCATWMGVVFINLSGDAGSFEDYSQPLKDRWLEFMQPEAYDLLRVPDQGGGLKIEVNCNWKLAVENFCESYHLPWLHPALNEYSPLSQHYNIMVDDCMSGQGSLSYRLASSSKDKLPLVPSWPDDKKEHAEYISFYPNVLLGIQVDHAFAMILQPIAPNKTIEKLELSYLGEGATDSRFIDSRDTVRESWRVVFREDIFAIEGMQKGRSSPGFDGGVFTPVQDVPTHHFHDWVARHYLNRLT